MKRKVCRYNCRTHKIEIVEEEMEEFPEIIPTPSPSLEFMVEELVSDVNALYKWSLQVSKKLGINPPKINLKK